MAYENWKVEEGWHTGKDTEVAKRCDFCVSDKATFIISDEVLGVINKLCEEIKEEWQLILLGEECEKNVVRVTDYYVPKQEYTAASVTNLDCIDKKFVEKNKVVATIHSHASMSPFFSSTDYDKTNTSLIKNHIVCNNKGEFVATKRIDLPCGMKKFVDAVVTRDLPPVKAVKKIRGFKNIKKKTWESVTTYYPSSIYPLGSEDGLGWDALPGKRKTHAFQFKGEKRCR